MIQITVPISAGDAPGVRRQAALARECGADLVEIRLDTCARLGARCDDVIAAIADMPLPVLATVRHASEGGDWDGDEGERKILLGAADRAGAAYVDCELRLAAGWRPTRAKLILSHHDFTGMGSGEASSHADLIQRMHAAGADVAKLALTPRDAADLAVIERLHRWERRPLVAIAMGEHGLPSRVLAGVWGGHLTFARIDGTEGSAPGQPTVRDLLGLYRLRSLSARTRVYGVIGSPVAHSLSPLIHNAAMAHHGLDAVYLPFRVEDAAAFWSACDDWLHGLSITIPYKQALIDLVDDVEELAVRAGAINTIFRDPDGCTVGANTDATAIIACLERALGSLAGRTVLVLGAGGVARAIVWAVRERGATVVIANRTPERARDLAREVGGTALAPEEARSVAYDVLVNGTSVGMKTPGHPHPQESPWPADAHRPGSVVFDTVYTPLETRLLKDALAAGCQTICGLDMFIEQAQGQFERWFGVTAPEPLMRRLALERLGATRTGTFNR